MFPETRYINTVSAEYFGINDLNSNIEH